MERKLNQLLLALLTVIVLSCGKDDPQPAGPSLEFSSDQITDGVFRGIIGSTENGTLSFDLEGSVPAGFKSLEIIRYLAPGKIPASEVIETIDDADKDFSYNFKYTLTKENAGVGDELKAVLTDKKGRTVSIDVAKIEAYWSLDNSPGIILNADMGEGITDNNNYYLVVEETGSGSTGPSIEVQARSPMDMLVQANYDEIHLIFDYDLTIKGFGGDPVGSYICSPKKAQTSNPELVDFFDVRNETIIKIITYASITAQELAAIDHIDKNDVLLLIDLFNKYQPGSNIEQSVFNGAQGDLAFILFKTADGKIGLIKDYQLEEVGFSAALSFDLWMMR